MLNGRDASSICRWGHIDDLMTNIIRTFLFPRKIALADHGMGVAARVA